MRGVRAALTLVRTLVDELHARKSQRHAVVSHCDAPPVERGRSAGHYPSDNRRRPAQ